MRTLVAAARGDEQQLRRSSGRFVDAAAAAIGTPGDVNSGSAGLLLGCAQLVESLEDPAVSRPCAPRAIAWLSSSQNCADRDGARPGETALGYLGAAHGWGGVAHALLRWSRATGQPPPPQALAVLERLIPLRRPSGRWPIRPGTREVWLGWCHGSAGWAQTWTLAWQATGDERFLALAEESAADAIAADMDNASLCCGRAGQAYAALWLYRATGEERWLAAAHDMAADAVRLSATDETPAALHVHRPARRRAAGDGLEDPGRAAMPVYQSLA